MKNKKFPTLHTNRIMLKDLKLIKEDIDNVFNHFSDSQITEFMDIDPCKSIEEAEEIIRFHVEDSGCRWGLYEKENNTFIGTCGFHCWSETNCIAEIGFDLRKESWGQGLMSEVLKAVLQFGFDSMNLIKIEATVEVENARSIKLLERNGFIREEEMREGLIYFYITKDMYYK